MADDAQRLRPTAGESARGDAAGLHPADAVSPHLLARALESLPASTAVLDVDGTIVSVNECWTEFALANNCSGALAATGVGVNYLEVCRRAVVHDASARSALEGIERVLRGEQASFTLEYPCHAPHQQRWFMLFAARLKGEAGAVITHFDITARRLLEGELRRTQGLLQSILDHTPALVFVKDLQQRYLLVNRRCEEVLGVSNDEIRGKTAVEVFPDEVARQFTENDGRTLSADAAHLVEETVPTREGVLTVASSQFPIRDATGRTVAIGGVSVDITARKAAEARQAMLVHELNHRMKNLLAVIQSIARNTFSVGQHQSNAYEEFTSRLQALARAQDLAVASKRGAEVRNIIASALAGFADRVVLEGPDIATKASFAQMLALAVHELATNAVKYGALSNANGHVSVRWAIVPGSEGRRLWFSWRESGGPRSVPRRPRASALVSSDRRFRQSRASRYSRSTPRASVTRSWSHSPKSSSQTERRRVFPVESPRMPFGRGPRFVILRGNISSVALGTRGLIRPCAERAGRARAACRPNSGCPARGGIDAGT